MDESSVEIKILNRAIAKMGIFFTLWKIKSKEKYNFKKIDETYKNLNFSWSKFLSINLRGGSNDIFQDVPTSNNFLLFARAITIPMVRY